MRISRKSVFKGRVIDVGIDHVELPNGVRCHLEIIRHPGGAAVVSLDASGRVCLLRQYRHAAESWLWELPAGKIDDGEPPDETARRELAEEAGVVAEQWESLGTMISSPGVFTERIYLYMATGLEGVPLRHEDGEVIEVEWIPMAEALEMAEDDRISDAKTLVGLYRAAARLGG